MSIYTWRTDAVGSDEEFASLEECLADVTTPGEDGSEWPKIGSAAERRSIAEGGWLCVYENGVPEYIRGEMP